ncbi:MAG: UDP-3-O-acyl-N-acetylglucosamine deacetylase [Chlamydiota bacterium]
MPVACKTRNSEELGVKSVVKRKQRTVQNAISVNGIGLFTGESVTLRLLPAEKETGILFVRTDTPEKIVIPSNLDHLISSSRCTMLQKDGCSIQTIEHLMAALHACGIGNVLVEVSGPEIPILDGSSSGFIELIQKAGICELDADVPVYTLTSPVYYSHNEVQLIALPSQEYRISYTLHYPHSSFLRSQFYSSKIDQETFISEIAPCRTFSLYEEVMPLIEKKFIKGGSLQNGVIIKGDEILNPEGARFSDEMVRHKVLDLVGDLALMGCFFSAHIIAIRSGHASNHALARELLKAINLENS